MRTLDLDRMTYETRRWDVDPDLFKTRVTWNAGVSVHRPEAVATLTFDDVEDAVETKISVLPAARLAPMQVWCQDKLVGHLQINLFSKSPMVSILVSDDGPVVSAQRVNRKETIDRFEIMRPGALDEVMLDRHIPYEAEREIMTERDALMFHWEALEVDLQAYEILFDHPEFDPA